MSALTPNQACAPPWVDAKAGDSFRRKSTARQPARWMRRSFVQKFARLANRGGGFAPASTNHCRQFMGMLADEIERRIAAVIEQPQVIHRTCVMPGATGTLIQLLILPHGPPHYVVGMAVIGIVEHHNLGALRRGARQT